MNKCPRYLFQNRFEMAEDLCEVEEFIRDHPFLATSASVALIGAGCIVVAPTIALGLLNIVGFGSLGPVGGLSYFMSMIYNALFQVRSLLQYSLSCMAAFSPSCKTLQLLQYPHR